MKLKVMAGLGAAALGLSLLSAPAQGAPGFTAQHVRMVGGPGHAGLYAWGMATDRNGDILIGDYWNQRVARYSASGAFKGNFVNNPGYGTQGHQSPYGLAVDKRDGSVYMADTDRRRVIKYNQNGRFLFRVGKDNVSQSGKGVFRYPSRVAVRSDGWFYVIDTWDATIAEFTPTGQERKEIAERGGKLGQIRGPHGADFDRRDRLFVADAGNKRVQVFNTKTGKGLFTFGSQGGRPGQFAGDIRGLCIDKERDFVYVVDGQGNRVNKFRTNGTFVKRWGSTGTGNGQFSDGGRECTVDKAGNVWVGDMPNFRAQKFSPNGAFLKAVPSPPKPPPINGFNGPRGVAVGKNGEIFVSDTYNWRISKFRANGTPVKTWGSRGRGPYKFNYTRLLDTDPRNGDVLVVDTDNNVIKRYDRNGVFKQQIGSKGTGPLKFKNPHGIDVNRDGKIAVANTQNAEIQILNPNGSFQRRFGSYGSGNGQLKYTRGVTWAPDGTLWVTDNTRDDLQHFSATGKFLGRYGRGILQNPFDVAASSTHVFVADSSANVIRVFRKNGAYLGSFGGAGKANGKLRTPQGLDLVGNQLYVSEKGNDRIQVFRIIT